jgi:hypothetical protein
MQTPMSGERELDAYLAGLFDGEGCVVITNTALPNRADSYCLRVFLTMVDREGPGLFHARFGGNFYEKQPANPRHRRQYTWQTSGKIAGAALEAMRPYLRVKRDQVELALEFQARKVGTGYFPLPGDELAIRAGYKLALSDAKREP